MNFPTRVLLRSSIYSKPYNIVFKNSYGMSKRQSRVKIEMITIECSTQNNILK